MVNKSKIEPSLTQKYIDSLREEVKVTDPDWVNIDMAKEFFASTSKLGSLEGADTSTVSVFEDGELIGYLFVTKDITSSKGYSSQEFDMLVRLGLDGKLTGAESIKSQ